MRWQVIKRPQAREDLIESFLYIELDNPAAAERFLEAAEHTFLEIAEMPLLGAQQFVGARRLDGLRSRHIKGFSNWLVFYVLTEYAVEVVRVLHGARDLEQVFAEEE
mgnify:CR=1 FL=1